MSQDVVDELSIYVVGYDRAGYGQSTPNPGRNLKSEAFDVQVKDFFLRFYLDSWNSAFS